MEKAIIGGLRWYSQLSMGLPCRRRQTSTDNPVWAVGCPTPTDAILNHTAGDVGLVDCLVGAISATIDHFCFKKNQNLWVFNNCEIFKKFRYHI